MAGLVGAQPGEVVVMNSLTVNLHLLMISFYRPAGSRTKLLIEEGAFPSDTYAAKSQVALHGLDVDEHLLLARPREGETLLRTEDIVRQIENAGSELALVMLPGVQYYTGQALDIEAITRAGHAVGALVGFDLAHAAGNLALNLHGHGVDFAAWCTYKYLNAGPGAVGAAFVHERHATRQDLPRLAGWWGNDPATRFKMHLIPEFTPQPGAAGWQLSNPPILGMTAMRRSLAIFHEAGMKSLRERALAMGEYFLGLIDALHPERIEVITPRESAARGCQLSLRVRDAPRELFEWLRAQGVVGDFRPPDVIRVAPTPLYNGYHDIWRFVDILGACAGR
jgi:kynureninase